MTVWPSSSMRMPESGRSAAARASDVLMRSPLLKRWQQYLAGYRAGGGHITDADLAALPMFLQLRHLWNMGEGVARIHHWGANMMSADWIKKQLDVMAAWARLELPPG